MKWIVYTLVFLMLLLSTSVGYCQGEYHEVDLSPYANANNPYVSLPTGDQLFNGIPFHLLTTNPSQLTTDSGSNNRPTRFDIPVSIPNTNTVYILAVGDYEFHWGYTYVGNFRFEFTDGSWYEMTLTNRASIRPWMNNLVPEPLSDPRVTLIYDAPYAGSGYYEILDLYTIDMPESNKTLSRISIVDTNTTTAISVLAVTAQTVPEPSSLIAFGSLIAPLGFLIRRRKG